MSFFCLCMSPAVVETVRTLFATQTKGNLL